MIRGCAAHKAAGLGCGTDYTANFVPLYSPVDGTIKKQYNGHDGGNWIWIEDAAGRMWEFCHLSAYKCKVGDHVKAGQEIAITGNTGTITTGPHCHVQIIAAGHNGDPNGPRIDPETLLNNAPLPMSENHSYDNQLIRLGTSLNYALVVRAKKHVFPSDENTLALLLILEKTGVIKVPHVDQAAWDSLPVSVGLKF